MLEFPDVDYPQKKKKTNFFSHSKSSIFLTKMTVVRGYMN